MKNIRESGIESLGGIPWGTHIAQFYSTQEDYLEVVVPYINAGLQNNELCVWIYSAESDYLAIKEKLSQSTPYLDERINRRQLLLLPYTEYYLDQGQFSEDTIMLKWQELASCALQEGYDGLRVAGDTSWVDHNIYKAFFHYERALNKNDLVLPFIVLCLYDTNRVDVFDIAEIIGSHGFTVGKRQNSLEIIKNVGLNVKDEQLQNSREKYVRLIQLLPDTVLIHDMKKIYYCNQSAVHLTGTRDTHELLGKDVSGLFPQEARNNLKLFLKQAMEDKEKLSYLKSKIICSNGEEKPVEIITTCYSLNNVNMLLSVVRDVTPFQKINELQETVKKHKELLNDTLENDRIKTEFLSNISHELRTPLNVILSVIQLLKLQNDMMNSDLKGNRYLKMMQQNCYRLLRLVNNLIDITKIDGNYFKIQMQNYDIVNLVEQITMSVVEYGRLKGITILFDTDVEEKIIPCDPDQVERIILNLLSNAIKFTGQGGRIWVVISSHKDKLTVSVKDTGIGIPKDKQETIFNRFQQAENSLTKRAEGSGIGLSLVKALVEMHNGTITLHSQEGTGSEFIVEFPCSTALLNEDGSGSTFPKNNLNHVDRLNIEFADIYS
jgi:PAS domain S-box-containing protein